MVRRAVLVTSWPRAFVREKEGRLVPGWIVWEGSKDSIICFRESVTVLTTGLGAVELKFVVMASSWEEKDWDVIFASFCGLAIVVTDIVGS